MSKPIIGITVHIEHDGNHNLHPDYIQAISEAGGVPLLIPVGAEKDLEQVCNVLDGLLLSGGYDVDPLTFGEEPHAKLGDVTEARDTQEFALIKQMIALEKPILGICRGEQILNIALGGTLYQDIAAQFEGEAIQHSQKAKRSYQSHYVSIVEGTILASIVGTEKVKVNSFHHQAVRNVGNSLIAAGKSSDGLIEAIEGTGKSFVLGVQWHPETLAVNGDATSKKIFDRFIQEARI